MAWRIGAETTYALEGAVLVSGALVQWLRDGLGIIHSAGEMEALAREVDTSDGVVIVPFRQIDVVIARLKEVKALEEALDAEVEMGFRTPIEELWASDRVTWID